MGYVLVIIIIGASNGGKAVESIPFATEALCNSASEKVISSGYYASNVITHCLKVR